MTNDKYIGYRIAANAAVLTTHLTVLSSMADVMDGQLLKHPELKIFHQLSLRYVTVWNVVFQVFYCSLALACDVTTLLGIPSTVPEKWRKFRFNIFSSLIYPVGMGVFLTFWPIFFYDRQLIFPLPADLVVTPFQNFMSHGGVFFYALCELVLLPREVTKFELKSLKTIAVFSVSYLATVLYTRYVEPGIWCYDMLSVTEGTSLFLIAFGYPISTVFVGFFAQWYIKDAVWKSRDLADKYHCT